MSDRYMKKTNCAGHPDLNRLKRYPISCRRNLVKAADFASGTFAGSGIFSVFAEGLPDILKGREFKDLVKSLAILREAGRPVLLGMGGHVVKCGLAPVVIGLMEAGAITGVAMNGSTAIHDFEMALMGETSEDVAESLGEGSFGMAEETGKLFNAAVSAALFYPGTIVKPDSGPSPGTDVRPATGPDVRPATGPDVMPAAGMGRALAAVMDGPFFPHRDKSILFNAARLGLPATVHVAMGTDIVHMHPEFDPAATGRATYHDFLTFSAVVGDMLFGGAYLNFGSAVILPEVFLKALTIARNLRAQSDLAAGTLPFVTADFDMIQHYRPTVNVVRRPTSCRDSRLVSMDRGYAFTGHHEIMLPLLANCLVSKLSEPDAGTGAPASRGGFVPRESAGDFFKSMRDRGISRLVFTNGCFDILHPGHARYLAAARGLGDALVVAINSDDSIRRIKGPSRPVNSEEVRAEMLLALSSVDFVTIFQEETPYRIIGEIRPDFLVKGGDWAKGSIVGEDLVRSWGGEVRSLPIEEGFSSTRIILAAGLGEATKSIVCGSFSAHDVLGVIPARFASTRFPGKPLAVIAGKTMIERVHARTSMANTLSRVVVATDDERIRVVVEAFGGTPVMTRTDHLSGSDRIAEVARKWGGDIVVNIQGDEPLIDPEDIDLAVRALIGDPEAMVATLATPFTEEEDPRDPSKVKVVIDSSGRALYFSRSLIPHFRDSAPGPGEFLKHVGLYAFRRSALDAFTSLAPSRLETIERLEQLRLLENGYPIKVAITRNSPLGVDTPEDLARAAEIISIIESKEVKYGKCKT